jgi:uncharacterized protein (TIGR03492 family)
MRDRLTARGLRRHGVAACAPGNPMMDGLERGPAPAWLGGGRRLLLLAGSRMPEALGNLSRLLEALPLGNGPITVLLAIGARPSSSELEPVLLAAGFLPHRPPPQSDAGAAWRRGAIELLVGQGCFDTWAAWAEVGLATAGTATEQLVGLGIPALSLPGPGPQFKAGFARRQSRLLGGAVTPCHTPVELRERLLRLLDDASARHRLGSRGRRRMGAAGASDRLAQLIDTRLLDPDPGSP